MQSLGCIAGALGGDLSSGAPPPPPPSDAAQQAVIDKLAAFVARNGPAFEAIVMRNHAADTHFGFLQGGAGAAYFRWKVLHLSSCHQIVCSILKILSHPSICIPYV